MKILFEDSEIIVCLKPRGILSQSDGGNKNDMISILESRTGSTVFPLHRLDKEVSGIMVYAKTKTSASRLSRDIAEHKFKKEYMALVHGKPEPEAGEMFDLLFKDSSKNKSYVVKRKRKGVKAASLKYSLINSKNGLSAVCVQLETGRTHQIRVQFASRKMPLAGDKKYGAKDNFETIGLYSYRLTFNHPTTEEEMQFCNFPEDFLSEYIN